MKHQFLPILFVFASALLLSGCGSTFEGLQRDFSHITTSLDNKIGEFGASNKEDAAVPKNMMAQSTNFNGTCPSITVNPQLDSMTEFYDLENPSEATKVSTIRLAKTASECVIDGDFLNMRVDLSFDGELGPKARRKSADKPFFAYPYFIAVLDGDGNELAKELFAASVTYDKNQEQIQLVETIRQKLPLNDDGTVPPYQVQIGFQLTEDQLFYNASL